MGTSKLIPIAIETIKLLFEKGADPTLGAESNDHRCLEKNGCEIVEQLTREISFPALCKIIEQYRPANTFSLAPLCEKSLEPQM